MKVTIDITQKELNALEDQTVCWNLCKEHNGIINATDEEFFAFTLHCPKCKKVNRMLRKSNLHLWVKLVDAYLKVTKEKRNNK